MIPLGTTAYNPQTGHQIVLTEKGWTDAGSPQMAASMSPSDQEGIGKLQGDASDAAWLAQKANQFRQIQQGRGGDDVTGTGGQFHEVHIPIPLLDKVNLNPSAAIAAAWNSRIGDMESVSNQAWTHMRPSGSGPMRMPEIEGFQQAFPNIENPAQTNSDITGRLNQDASFAAQKLQFIDSFIRQNRGTYADANAAWQAAQMAPGNGSVLYGQGSPQQGQPVTQGQQGFAQANPAAGPVGGAQNPYYATPQGQAPAAAYQVMQNGQYVAPQGQLNMQNGQAQPQQQGAPQLQPGMGGSQPAQAPVLTWDPQTGKFQ